jgi:hypothetical protein
MIGCAVVALQDPGVRVVLSRSFGNVTKEHRAELPRAGVAVGSLGERREAAGRYLCADLQ